MSDDIFTKPPKAPPENIEEANDRFIRHFDRAQEIASANNPTKVRAYDRQQGGQDILVGRCPCGHVAGMSGGEGRICCPFCHRWLHYVQEG